MDPALIAMAATLLNLVMYAAMYTLFMAVALFFLWVIGMMVLAFVGMIASLSRPFVKHGVANNAE